MMLLLNEVCALFFLISSFQACYGENQNFEKNFRGTCSPWRRNRPMFISAGLQCTNKVLSRDMDLRFNPEIGKNTTEILTSRRYTVSEYETISEDGYISLTVRVSGGGNSPPRQGKEPVLLFHGIGTSSGVWIIQPGKRNLVAMLIDAGYDVWLINGRGSIPSRRHTSLNPDVDLKYWEYSMDEMVTKDLPPIINLILKETSLPKIHLICYSMGCGAYFIGLSEMVELNDKLQTGILFAPGGYVGYAYGPLRLVSNILSIPGVADSAFALFRGRISFNSKTFSKAFGLPPEFLCSSALARCMLCDNLIFALFGGDPGQMNFTNLPYAYTHLHDAIPLHVMRHFSQNMRNCLYIRKYDFGRELNLLRYGSSEPPEYDLKKISVPSFIFYAESDNMMTEPDIFRTAMAMSSKAVKLVQKVAWPRFTHNDFVMAKDADTLVYRHVLKILAKQTIRKS